jgi:ABC-type nitrate/sulfonate/bicarbonate transport system ATPase subunit
LEERVIELRDVKKSFGETEVLRDISIEVERGELISILGPSGCGKSTLMNLMTGILDADGGNIDVRGKIGFMQQKDLLLPWRTAIDNVILPLLLRGGKKRELHERAGHYFSEFGLAGYERRYPDEMSGGMRQRASFLRTFLSSGEILLLDEPFGALDAITRARLQNWLLEIKSRVDVTILFITHDIEEAILMSDRIYILSQKPAFVLQEMKLDFHAKNKPYRTFDKMMVDYKAQITELLQTSLDSTAL